MFLTVFAFGSMRVISVVFLFLAAAQEPEMQSAKGMILWSGNRSERESSEGSRFDG